MALSDSEWKQAALPEVIDFKEGPGILARDFREAGIPLVRLAGLSDNSLLAGSNHLEPTMVERKWSHFRLELGDTLISASASLGRIARVGSEAVGAIPYTGIIRMRPRDGRLRPDFLPYLLDGPDFQRQAEAMGAGSVLRHFGPSHLQHMTLNLPPVGDQARITEVLGRLNSKIRSNRRVAALLEQTAEAEFRARFVDFVGVPDTVTTELGAMPFEWRPGRLADLVEITMGQSPPSSTYSADRASGPPLVQGMGSFGERFPETEMFTLAPTRLAPPGATLMTVRAPVGSVNIARTEVCLGRGVAGITSPHRAFTEFLVKSLESRWRLRRPGRSFRPSTRHRCTVFRFPFHLPRS